MTEVLVFVWIQMGGKKMCPVDTGLESCCCLFQNILKRTKEGTTEEQTASKALASVSKVNASHSSRSACKCV